MKDMSKRHSYQPSHFIFGITHMALFQQHKSFLVYTTTHHGEEQELRPKMASHDVKHPVALGKSTFLRVTEPILCPLQPQRRCAPKEKGANLCCQASQPALPALNPPPVLLRVQGLSAFCSPMQFHLSTNAHLLFTVCTMRKGVLKRELNIDISHLRLRQNSCIHTYLPVN